MDVFENIRHFYQDGKKTNENDSKQDKLDKLFRYFMDGVCDVGEFEEFFRKYESKCNWQVEAVLRLCQTMVNELNDANVNLDKCKRLFQLFCSRSTIPGEDIMSKLLQVLSEMLNHFKSNDVWEYFTSDSTKPRNVCLVLNLAFECCQAKTDRQTRDQLLYHYLWILKDPDIFDWECVHFAVIGVEQIALKHGMSRKQVTDAMCNLWKALETELNPLQNHSSFDYHRYKAVFAAKWCLDNVLELAKPEMLALPVKFSSDKLSVQCKDSENYFTVYAGNEVTTTSYFEVILMTNGPMRIGWTCRGKQKGHTSRLGDDFGDSIGFDGYSGKIFHLCKNEDLNNLTRWSMGDRVGCLIDVPNRNFSFFHNGELVLYKLDTHFSESSYFASVTLFSGQQCYFNFGNIHPFINPPPNNLFSQVNLNTDGDDNKCLVHDIVLKNFPLKEIKHFDDELQTMFDSVTQKWLKGNDVIKDALKVTQLQRQVVDYAINEHECIIEQLARTTQSMVNLLDKSEICLYHFGDRLWFLRFTPRDIEIMEAMPKIVGLFEPLKEMNVIQRRNLSLMILLIMSHKGTLKFVNKEDDGFNYFLEYLLSVIEESEHTETLLYTVMAIDLSIRQFKTNQKLKDRIYKIMSHLSLQSQNQAIDPISRSDLSTYEYQLDFYAYSCLSNKDNFMGSNLELESFKFSFDKLSIAKDSLSFICEYVEAFSRYAIPYPTTDVFFYEVILLTKGPIEIGWKMCDGKFINHSVNLSVGDVVGCLLDTSECKVIFYYNGAPLEYKIDVSSIKGPIRAAVRLYDHQHCYCNFGQLPFKYEPKNVLNFHNVTNKEKQIYKLKIGDNPYVADCIIPQNLPPKAPQTVNFATVTKSKKYNQLVSELEDKVLNNDFDGKHLNETFSQIEHLDWQQLFHAVIDVFGSKLTDEKIEVFVGWIRLHFKPNFHLFESFLDYTIRKDLDDENWHKKRNSYIVLWIHLIYDEVFFCCGSVHPVMVSADTFLSRSITENQDKWIQLIAINWLNVWFIFKEVKKTISKDTKLLTKLSEFAQYFDQMNYNAPVDPLTAQIGFCSRMFMDKMFPIERPKVSCAFNPSDKTRSLEISPDNLSVRSMNTGWQSVRSTFPVSSSAFYYETMVLTGGIVRIGFSTKWNDLDTQLGGKEHSIELDLYHNCIWINGSIKNSLKKIEVCKVGDVVGCLIDLSHKDKESVFKFYLNGKPLKYRLDKNSMTFNEPYHALVRLTFHQQVFCNFGQMKFHYPLSGNQNTLQIKQKKVGKGKKPTLMSK